MITDANAGQYLIEQHPDFSPLYQTHLNYFGTDPSSRYLLFQAFAREYVVPLLKTGTLKERTAVFDTIEQLLAECDTLIDDAVDHEIIAELVYVGYVVKDEPRVDLTGAGPLTTGRIVRTRDWPSHKP